MEATDFYSYAYGEMSPAEARNFETILRKDTLLRREFEAWLDSVAEKFVSHGDVISLLNSYLPGKRSDKGRNLFLTLLRYKENLAYEVRTYLDLRLRKYSEGGVINLFDLYVEGGLPHEVEEMFALRLEVDQDFAEEFRVYLFTVYGICKEAEQDNLDFGKAMGGISEGELKEAIDYDEGLRAARRFNEWHRPAAIVPMQSMAQAPAPKSQPSPAAAQMDTAPTRKYHGAPMQACMFGPTGAHERPKRGAEHADSFPAKRNRRRWSPVVFTVAIAIIGIFATFLLMQEKERRAVDHAIFTCAEYSTEIADSPMMTAFHAKHPGLLDKEGLTELSSLYHSATKPADIAASGYYLAMTYLELHNRDKARQVLRELVTHLKDNPDYLENVRQWQAILQLIE